MTRLMNRVNRKIADRTIDLLELDPAHHVLEIGFGGGAALSLLTPRLTAGGISGADFSADMVHRADKKFRDPIAHARLQLKLGDVSRLPYPDSAFDRVFTINTIYFWPDALEGLTEIRRVLYEGGRAAISVRSKEKMEKYGVTQHGFRLFSSDDLAGLMRGRRISRRPRRSPGSAALLRSGHCPRRALAAKDCLSFAPAARSSCHLW
jgi:ubiquinone/menaquinone biosynthesis C-methylase UbiE